MRPTLLAAGVGLALALAACGGSAASGAQGTAENITKAAYDNDAAGVMQSFDDTLKAQVTRSDVGSISDRMHALGDYQGLTYVSNDPLKNEYTYRANFSKGAMSVVLRLDPDGKVAAYRVIP